MVGPELNSPAITGLSGIVRYSGDPATVLLNERAASSFLVRASGVKNFEASSPIPAPVIAPAPAPYGPRALPARAPAPVAPALVRFAPIFCPVVACPVERTVWSPLKI